MYAIACKFPHQKKFETMDTKTGEQVNSWMYCTLFKTKERAEEVLNNIKALIKPDIQLKIVEYKNNI